MTKTEAKQWLRDKLRDLDDGLPIAPSGYTVGQAVLDWLKYGLNNRDASTIENRTILAETHIVPYLGRRKLHELSADEVDKWLADRAQYLSSDTLRRILSILRRSISRAQARDKVKRNVALLCTAPAGRAGRPSKSLTLDQANAVLEAAEAEGGTFGTYVVVSLLSGVRTEEVRALTWDHVSLDTTPAYIEVWRSVRTGGDTKTEKSRRTLKQADRCTNALQRHKTGQADARRRAGARWVDHDLVFSTKFGTRLDAGNVRRAFRRIIASAGLNASEWTPRELRHSFVSILSDAGVPIEEISRLVGHGSTKITEQVYRHQLRPVLTEGAEAMDEIFGSQLPAGA